MLLRFLLRAALPLANSAVFFWWICFVVVCTSSLPVPPCTLLLLVDCCASVRSIGSASRFQNGEIG